MYYRFSLIKENARHTYPAFMSEKKTETALSAMSLKARYFLDTNARETNSKARFKYKKRFHRFHRAIITRGINITYFIVDKIISIK